MSDSAVRTPFPKFSKILCFLFLAGLPSSPAWSQSCTLPPGAVSWWPGNGNANDVLGANPGTLEGGVTFADGLVGKAFAFNGQPDGGGVRLNNVPAFDFSPDSSFTLEAWVKSVGPTRAPNDSQNILILNYNCGNTVQFLAVTAAGERLIFQVRDADGKTSGALMAAMSKGVWHHVAGVRDTGSVPRSLRLYLDGSLVGTVVDQATGALASNTPDVIGRRNLCGTLNTFNGLIDEPAVYNRALSDQEIAGIFRAGGAGKRR